MLTVALITRTIQDSPTEVRVGPAQGLKEASVANLDALQTASKRRIGRLLGTIGPQRRREIRDALLFALELED